MVERQKLEGDFLPERYLFKPLSMLKSLDFPVRGVEIGAERKVNFFCNISDGKVIFFRNFEPCLLKLQ